MITHSLAGGLGNQLFQIYTTISLAMNNNDAFCFPNSSTLGSEPYTVRRTYWKDLFSTISFSLYQEKKVTKVIISEKNHGYDKIEIDYKDKADLIELRGYFQSYKYFDENMNKISCLLDIEGSKKNIVDSKKFTPRENSISMHFRVGDYKSLPDYHPILNIEYYEKSLHYILTATNIDIDTIHVYYFHEDEDVVHVDNIIELLKQKFPTILFLRIESSIVDWQQMLIMSLCDHNIIANSTFSLWGGYFNNNTKKIVCYPSLWFGKYLPLKTEDMYPDTWIKIKI